MKPTLLIVEDDLEIARLLGILLEAEGFAHRHCSNAEDALRLCTETSPALAILDVMLPGEDGLWCCRQLRKQGFSGAILMLTASEGDITEVVALNGGADDYLQKPIRPHVLIARIRALLRRDAPESHRHRLAGGFVFDQKHRELHWDAELVALTDAELDLLAVLVEHDGPISRDACFVQLRGIEYDGIDRAIDMRVSTLRKKLARYAPGVQVVRTLRAQGYQVMKER